MGTQWSEQNIVRLLVGITTDAVYRNPKVVVRSEALVMAMHAVLIAMGRRFPDRAESMREEYFSEMKPYLVAAGLPADRAADHFNRRSVEYGQLVKEWAETPGSPVAMVLGSTIAANVTGCRPEQVDDETTGYWLSRYMGLLEGTAETLDRDVLRRGFVTRMWRRFQRIIRGN